VTRHEATERPFTGALLNEHERGIFHCVCCDLPLFSSGAKFESGTGWPSFYQPIAEENVAKTVDGSLMEVRTAVSCRLCDAHLGHVFDDGPPPTGLRYCMNSVSLRFTKLVS
jgi:peptide-methionine (R)-S-oxide reductase